MTEEETIEFAEQFIGQVVEIIIQVLTTPENKTIATWALVKTGDTVRNVQVIVSTTDDPHAMLNEIRELAGIITSEGPVNEEASTAVAGVAQMVALPADSESETDRERKTSNADTTD